MNSIPVFDLNPSITQEQLIASGFRKIGKCYKCIRSLYKDIIAVRFIIYTDRAVDDDRRSIEYEVFDKNSQSLYNAFYYNINGTNNLVANCCIDEFGKIIQEMNNKGIIKLEDDTYECDCKI